MAKHLITLHVDDGQVFDMVHKVGDGGAALGARLACVLLAPKHLDLITALGLAVYGIRVETVEVASTEAADGGR